MVNQKSDAEFYDLTFEKAVLDSLPANIAVIDSHGEILSVNAGWEKFAQENKMHDASMGIGANYLDVCRAASTDPSARAALVGIREVILGKRKSFYLEYPCHSPTQFRWFALRAAPLLDYPHFVVLSHEDITERKLTQEQAP